VSTENPRVGTEDRIRDRIAGLLECSPGEVAVEPSIDGTLGITAEGARFRVAWAASGDVAPVTRAIDALEDGATPSGVVPLVAAPFLGAVGRRKCEEAGIGWFDLSGNAAIRAPGLKILVDGAPNRFRRPGRPSTPFGPKGSRLARWILAHHPEAQRQVDLAQATRLSEGYVSRLVARLAAADLIERRADGLLACTDPAQLLDAWVEADRFDRHDVRRGTVAARSGTALLDRIATYLADVTRPSEGRPGYALTGLAAAWLFEPFASFRTVTVYLTKPPRAGDLDALGFVDDPRGANLWLVVPHDDGVFDVTTERRGLSLVHPVQAYVDLAAQPERAQEAAEQLRRAVIEPAWGRRG
jgi:hypothetical protein